MFEYTHTTKSKWPLQFDLEGVPRDRDLRKMELERLQGEQMSTAMNDPQVIDLSNPPRQPYTFQAYPRTMYAADGRFVSVENEKQQAKAEKQGFQTKPYPEFDYSKIEKDRAVKRPVSDEAAPVDLSE